MQSSKKTLLSLILLGIGHRIDVLSESVNWNEVQALADRQGLAAVLVDGIEQLPDSHRPPKEDLLQMIGQVVQNYEYRYELYRKAIAEMAAWYNAHGFKMMVLKGYACSLDWTKPEHRPCGDIDIWLFGKQKEADALMAKELGLKVDSSHHHHTVFNWRGFSVENHYDFNHVHHHKSGTALEKIFKELGQDDKHWVEMPDTLTGSAIKVYLPSPNLHALFLMKHSMTDFAAFFVTIRQVLDWAFFVEKNSKEVDWNWLIGLLEEFHMIEFFNCINAICVDDLGFNASIFPYVQYNPMLKDKVLSDILEPRYSREEPVHFIPRLLFKLRRWKGNAWKHKMCYNESLWSGFWSGVWNHLLKPSSI